MAAPDDDDAPRLPDDFSVQDILDAPLRAREPDAAAAHADAEREARGALWEIDFALQELEWLQRDGVEEGALLQSVVSQIRYGAGHVERFPLALLPLSDDLREELAERFALLSAALDELPEAWAGHEDVHRAHAQLRAGLEQRGVDVG